MGISLNIRNKTTQKNVSKCKLKVDLCNMGVSSVITGTEPIQGVRGPARIVLQKWLWISVILAQTAFMKQILTWKITN